MNSGSVDDFFTNICSSKTLQANESGFFGIYCQTVEDSFKGEENYKNWLKTQFGKAPTDYAKLQLLYNDPTTCGEIIGTLEHVQEVYRKKDALFSWNKVHEVQTCLRKYNNGANIDLNKVLILASIAVMRSPMEVLGAVVPLFPGVDSEIDKGITLAIALAQRSEVFLYLKDGENALKDLQLAVQSGLPTKNNSEYYARMAKCYTLMNEKARSDISVKLYYQLCGLDDLKKKKLETELEEMKKDLDSSKVKAKPTIKKPLPELSRKLNPSNDVEKCTSNKCKLMNTQEAGKYFVANEEMSVGETVLVEPAKCSSLYPKNFGSHCNLCFSRLIAPIGCTDCASVAFCSIECRDKALSSYHKFECKFLDMLIGSGMSILCQIALKIVTNCKTPDEALKQGKILLAGLCVHSQARKNEDYFKRGLMATFLLRILQKSEFFGRRKSESADATPKELEIGALIFSLLQALQFNAHEIYETVTSGEHKFNKSKINYIGVGIYEAGALFNHDCYPAICRYFNGTQLIFTTIRPLAANEVIAENYGPIFTKQSLVERQRNLSSRYWFKCLCRACVEDWPVLEKLNNKSRMKCTTPNCPGIHLHPHDKSKASKCRLCKKNVSLEMAVNLLNEAEDLYIQGAMAMDNQEIPDAISFFKNGLEIFNKVALSPHKDTHIAQEALRACLADNGNTFNVVV